MNTPEVCSECGQYLPDRKGGKPLAKLMKEVLDAVESHVREQVAKGKNEKAVRAGIKAWVKMLSQATENPKPKVIKPSL
jgi:hypothetical protein